VWRRKAGCELRGMEDLLCAVDGRRPRGEAGAVAGPHVQQDAACGEV
jgi:hypothetical protein